jgi:hypothetical protein
MANGQTGRLGGIGTPLAAAIILAGIAASPRPTYSDDSAATPCVEALEQVTALEEAAPVYKATGADQREYIADEDRPAEIARLQKVIEASCSAEREARLHEVSEAKSLHIARSPDCAIQRDTLASMEKPNSHEPKDFIATQRKLVSEKCPTVTTVDVWLVATMKWNRPDRPAQ